MAAQAYSEVPGMPRNWIPAALTVVVLACASCGKGSEEPPLVLPSRASTGTPTASPSVSSELAGYTADERQAFQAAVTAYRWFLVRNSQFLARGKTSTAANEFYRRYSIDWVESWANLAQLGNNDVIVSGSPRELWIRPERVILGAEGAQSVQLRRCLDETGLVIKQAGKRVAQPQLRVPHVYEVRLVKKAAEHQWRAGTARQGKTC